MNKAISILAIVWLSLFAFSAGSQADSIDRKFVESQVSLAERFMNGDRVVHSMVYGIAIGVQEMHNMLHEAFDNPAQCVLTNSEIHELSEEVARDTLAVRYPTLSIREMVVIAVDHHCEKQTGSSLSGALYSK